MAIVGHTKTLATLPKPLPQCLLLTGPEGVGKRLIANRIAVASGAKGTDFQNLGKLDKAGALSMIEHHSRYPLHSEVKTTLADMSRSSPEATNSILKLLENPPEFSRFILHSDTEPLLTIRSRCFNLRFGTLSDEEVRTVLTSLQGIPEGVIPDAVKFSQGRVSLALAHVAHSPSKKHAQAILRAVHTQDEVTIERALTEALEPAQGEPRGLVEQRRGTIANLLSMSLSASMSSDHPLAWIPLEVRVNAIRVLRGAGRPALKVRAATWMMLAD